MHDEIYLDTLQQIVKLAYHPSNHQQSQKLFQYLNILIKYYSEKGRLKTIDASSDVVDVSNKIIDHLESTSELT